MGRHSCCYKQKLRKGLWSPEEDEKLLRHITKYGHGCWSSVPKQAGLQRCGKSCRLRWINYLRPDLKRGTFSQQEENLIVELHAKLGNRWSQIAAQLPGRTDNEIKNLWNSSLKKRLRQSGIDPSTHKPLSEVDGIDADNTNNNKSTSSANDKPTAAAVSPTSLNSAAAEPSPTARVANPPVGVVPRMKELSLDRCREVMDPIDMEYFPGNYATTAATSSIGCGGLNAISSSTNSLMWFNQTAADFSISSVLPAAASSVLSIPMRLKQMAATGLLMDVGMPQNYWETGAASSNNSSCTTGTSASSIGLQTAVAGTSAGSLFDAAGAGFAWPELGQPDKDGAFHLDGREAEVFKWSEFIQTASAAGTGFPNSGTMISQQGVNTNSLFEDTKCGAGGGDTQFVIDELSAWQQSLEQQQHQHQPQLPDLYGKDFQRISAAFGQM